MNRKTFILILLALSQFLVILDSSIVNIALPAIKEAMHFENNTLQWVLTSYILAFGGFLMLGGRLADLYGRRKMLVIGVLGFTTVSFLIGISTSSIMLIVLRSLQGIFAALMSPAALSILLTSFNEGDERNKALSIWSLVATGGAAAGVIFGGIITQYLGWQWNFFVNVPIGLLAAVGILKYVPAHIKEAKDHNLDVSGAILITTGLILLVYAFTQAPEIGWLSATTLVSFVIGIALIIGFVINEKIVSHPLAPLSIFKNRNLVGGSITMFLLVTGVFGQFYFVTQYIQNILKYSPTHAGLAFLPLPITIGLVTSNSPRLIKRFGPKKLAMAGTLIAALGLFILSSLGVNSQYLTHLLPGFILLATGMGLCFVSVTIATTSGITGDKAGLTSGILNTSQQLGGAVGIAILTVVATIGTDNALLAKQSLTNATLAGYHMAFITAMLFILLAFVIVTFVIKTKKISGNKSEVISTH